MRIGYGWDSHEFKRGLPLVIGGVKLQHSHGLAGHSDGDVLLHALTDALLGAIAAGDIGGYLFPSFPKKEKAGLAVFVVGELVPNFEGRHSRFHSRSNLQPARANNR